MRPTKRVLPARRTERTKGAHKKWVSPRKRQRIDYEPMGKTKKDSNSDYVEDQWDQWNVTCGTKKGILYTNYLERGEEDCIECNGHWFSPTGFEELGGRGAHKKWKRSITYKNKSLDFWIEHGNLKVPPVKRRMSAASVPSNPKKSHPQESVEKSDHEESVGLEQQPEETSEKQTDAQNGEQTNDITTDNVSQMKPKLILRRLELQGNFHQLLNDVVLPQNGTECMPTEEQSEEKTDLSENHTPGLLVETSEPQEEMLQHSSNNENEVPCTEYTMTTMDNIQDPAQPIERPPQEDDPCNVLAEADPPALAHTSAEVDVMEEGTPLDVIIQDSAQQLIERPQEDDSCNVLAEADPPALAHTSTEVDVMEEGTPLDVIIQDSAQQLIERPQEDDSCNVLAEADPPALAHTSAEVDVMEEGTPLDVIIQDSAQQLIERPLQEDNPCSVLAEPPATANINAKVEVMDLGELKREKIKWQIKVLKLQEEYYSLQLQKLKQ